ncbi:MAG: Uma2 family endonuclease, partial [Aquificaceae bacterium]|nr:Uma2 family endonuclease [Aquificaceae bacterium]
MKLKYLPHYTYEDYQKWQGDWELLEGIPYAMASPLYTHQRLVFLLFRHLEELFEKEDCHCLCVGELDWVISEDTVVRPDLVVLCEEPVDYIRKPPLLVVEVVSEGTKRMDEEIKFELYQAQGVKYYLLVYPEKKDWKLFENTYGAFVLKDRLELELKDCKINLELE